MEKLLEIVINVQIELIIIMVYAIYATYHVLIPAEMVHLHFVIHVPMVIMTIMVHALNAMYHALLVLGQDNLIVFNVVKVTIII